MRPYLVVIFHVRQQDMTEVSLAEHNHVVKALPSDRTDQPFGISVLPWGARRCRPATNGQLSRASDEDFTIGPIPVTDQVAGSLFPTACFRDLICDPWRCGNAISHASPWSRQSKRTSPLSWPAIMFSTMRVPNPRCVGGVTVGPPDSIQRKLSRPS